MPMVKRIVRLKLVYLKCDLGIAATQEHNFNFHFGNESLKVLLVWLSVPVGAFYCGQNVQFNIT